MSDPTAVVGEAKPPIFLDCEGHCPVCGGPARFTAWDPKLRDYFICRTCRSVPRERALMSVLESYFPQWSTLAIHESSPAPRGVSERLRAEGQDYVASQFFPGRELGTVDGGVRCEDLERLTFADESIDLHITQDVLEHVFHPADAFREIARTLRPGGAHIFTTPLVYKTRPSVRRARLRADGTVEHLFAPVYHGNPISADGSLVTVDWGFDIVEHIFAASGLVTQTVIIDDLSRGIRADYIEVLVTLKPHRRPTPI